MLKISEEFKGYKEEIKKCGLSLYDLDNIAANYKVTMTQETYKKLGRKYFPKKPTETETQEISARQLACYLSSISFFNDRVEKNYTTAGYVVTKLTSISPDKEIKIIRKIRYEYIG